MFSLSTLEKRTLPDTLFNIPNRQPRLQEKSPMKFRAGKGMEISAAWTQDLCNRICLTIGLRLPYGYAIINNHAATDKAILRLEHPDWTQAMLGKA
jgi:hypothetical protein